MSTKTKIKTDTDSTYIFVKLYKIYLCMFEKEAEEGTRYLKTDVAK